MREAGERKKMMGEKKNKKKLRRQCFKERDFCSVHNHSLGHIIVIDY